MWVEHCRRSGEFLARLMVITDDEVDTASSCVCHFIHRLDTAVERDNKLAARRLRIVDSLKGDTVSLAIAVGDIEVNGIGKLSEKRENERDGRGTIYIVIAIDEYALFTGNSL